MKDDNMLLIGVIGVFAYLFISKSKSVLSDVFTDNPNKGFYDTGIKPKVREWVDNVKEILPYVDSKAEKREKLRQNETYANIFLKNNPTTYKNMIETILPTSTDYLGYGSILKNDNLSGLKTTSIPILAGAVSYYDLSQVSSSKSTQITENKQTQNLTNTDYLKVNSSQTSTPTKSSSITQSKNIQTNLGKTAGTAVSKADVGKWVDSSTFVGTKAQKRAAGF